MKLLPCALGPSLTVQEASTLGPNFCSATALPEKTTEISLGYSAPISCGRTDFLFAYDIFPRFLMRAEAQWIPEGRPMGVGDLIVQRAVFPPIGFGLCAEFGYVFPRSSVSREGSGSLMRHLPVIWSEAYRSSTSKSALARSFSSSIHTQSRHTGCRASADLFRWPIRSGAHSKRSST
jgi:hypothetical protein